MSPAPDESAPGSSDEDADDETVRIRPAAGEFHELTNEGDLERLDILLVGRLPHLSRALIQKLIHDGQVTVSSCLREVKPSIKVPPGARVTVNVPPPRKVDLSPQDIPFDILYEDAHLAVIDKPAGIAVHPAPDQLSGTLVNGLLFRLKGLSSIGGEERPGIIHRLDKETSGVLVVAKNDLAHRAISTQFKERIVHKTYLAIVRGEPQFWEGHVTHSLGRSYANPKKQMVRHDGSGREAATDYRVLEKYHGYALVECYPRTGRTHQIRVHMASLRLPVACDKLYGREKRIFLSDLQEQARDSGETPIMERHALHAASLSFLHPITREELTFSAGLHPDMHGLLKALERFRSFG